jgi:hypothetical protein
MEICWPKEFVGRSAVTSAMEINAEQCLEIRDRLERLCRTMTPQTLQRRQA